MVNTLFLLEGEEAVARILVDFAIAWKVTWSALATLLVLSEEVDGLRFAAT